MTDSELITALVTAGYKTIERHGEELTALDQAIGDGDHGINMMRGFTAVADETEVLAAMTFGDALKKAGMTLVMKVGGASGPLYGSALMDMGKATSECPQDNTGVAAVLAAGIEAVKRRGKSDAGAKTMLDVLIPLQEAIAATSELAEIRKVIDEAVENTKPMRATKGRAAYLGERSIGHVDPGARSSALLAHAVCNVLEGS